jgi:beta-glucosidase
MDEVEMQREDVPEDMTPWQDTEGNTYDFGFGLL